MASPQPGRAHHLGIGWDGRRHVWPWVGQPGAPPVGAPPWPEDGLHGVCFVVSDDHPGLKRAIRGVARSQLALLCHFLRNALDHLPRKHADDCLLGCAGSTTCTTWRGRRPRDGSSAGRARTTNSAMGRGQHRGDLHFHRLPRAHHKHLKSTNLIERLNQEIKRRTCSCASSQMRPAVCAWCALAVRSTRSGSMRTTTSTWNCCAPPQNQPQPQAA